MKNQKLELTWIGKDIQPKLEPRILIEDPDKSYGDRNSDNMLIFGDNLLALKALEQEFTGRIKCIFIDPPYNTGSAFAHYDDGVEHSLWLTLMRDRLEILRRLLTDNGSLWITIDDNEAHYLKVICDEVFGRRSFVTSFIWRKVDSPNDNKGALAPDHEYVLCYTKTPGANWFKQKKDESILDAYRQPDASSDRPYRDRLLKKNGKNSMRSDRPSMFFPIKGPDGVDVFPIHDDGKEARWALGKKGVEDLIEKNELVWKQRELNGVVRWVPYTREYAPKNPSRPFPTIWADLDTTRQTKAHQKIIFGETAVFDTPKPEDLVCRALEISTDPGDIVLDSFSGSGTTGASAHKIGRKWIMIELGDHCHTLIQPRMQKVCNGTDQGGISKAVNWQGGGGFKYYYMAPSLLKKDHYDQWVINEEYNPTMVAAAMAKHESFCYCPDEFYYWKQGRSSEKDYIFTTTVHLTPEHLDRIHEEMQPDESLLICCKSHFEGADGKYGNITVKKIPAMLLGKCEFDRDDYSLNIVDMPRNPDEPDFVPSGPTVVETKKEEKKSKAELYGQMNIFAGTGE